MGRKAGSQIQSKVLETWAKEEQYTNFLTGCEEMKDTSKPWVVDEFLRDTMKVDLMSWNANYVARVRRTRQHQILVKFKSSY